MQMKALRSLNFAKLSSSSSTSDEYWVTSISAGTPAGYCLSQIRSMVLPLWLFPLFVGPGALFFGSIENAAADGKRLRAIDASGFEPDAREGVENRLIARHPGGISQPAWSRFWASRRPWAWPASRPKLRASRRAWRRRPAWRWRVARPRQPVW